MLPHTFYYFNPLMISFLVDEKYLFKMNYSEQTMLNFIKSYSYFIKLQNEPHMRFTHNEKLLLLFIK